MIIGGSARTSAGAQFKLFAMSSPASRLVGDGKTHVVDRAGQDSHEPRSADAPRRGVREVNHEGNDSRRTDHGHQNLNCQQSRVEVEYEGPPCS